MSLQRVLQEIDVDEILCVGDLVDYDPWPREVIEMGKSHHIQSVMGNHDRDAA